MRVKGYETFTSCTGREIEMWGSYDVFLKLQINDSTEMYHLDAVVPSSHLSH